MKITPARMKKFEATSLSSGSHKSIGDGACVMEMVAYLANEPWSDHPRCACPAITAFAIRLNDSGPQWVRDELKRRVINMIGTRSSVETQKSRARIFVDFAIVEAERVLPIFEKARPGDERPRKAIEAARTANTANANAAAAAAAANAAYNAVYAADAAAAANAANAAYNAADAAANAAADAAADAAANAAADAANAAYNAAYNAAADAAYAAAYAADDRWKRQLAALDAAIEIKDAAP